MISFSLSMCVCVCAELPSLLPVVSVAEALLRLKNGPLFLSCLIANMPDQLNHGERERER